MSRFDYIQYDETAAKTQATFKKMMETVEAAIENGIKDGRSKATAITRLEEVYMWIGKGIRNDQIARNGTATLREGRNNG